MNSSSSLNKTESGENNEDVFWKVVSYIALVECALGIISNSLLLFLTYSNPLNNLRKSSWITITNLAVADLLTSILSIFFCHPVYELALLPERDIQHACTEVLLHIGYASSFFLLMLFAIERYIAIKHPFESGNILTRKRIFLACLLCWAAAIGCALPIILRSQEFIIALYGILEFSALVMILFQVLIIKGIKEASRHLEDGSTRKAHMKNVSTTIVILILVLMVTTFPYFIAKQVEFLYRDYPNLFTGKVARLFPYYYFPIACLNFIVNPFIYALRLPDYRNALRELLNRKLLKRERRAERNSNRFCSRRRLQEKRIMTTC